jgi:hypothetical protein
LVAVTASLGQDHTEHAHQYLVNGALKGQPAIRRSIDARTLLVAIAATVPAAMTGVRGTIDVAR